MKGEAGFTLLEVLVAFTILAMAGVVIMQSVGLSARSAARAEARMEVVSEARNLLVQAGLPPMSASETVSGTSRTGLSWALTSTRSGDLVIQRLRLEDQFGRPFVIETVRSASELEAVE